MKIYIEPAGEDKFTVLIDGVPSGEYTTVKKAKAGARRFFPPNHHVKWETRIDGKLEKQRGGRDECMENPGSSALWIGVEPGQTLPTNHVFTETAPITLMHLNVTQVQALISTLQGWVDRGELR